MLNASSCPRSRVGSDVEGLLEPTYLNLKLNIQVVFYRLIKDGYVTCFSNQFMKTVVILIDFDNIFPLPIGQYSFDSINSKISHAISLAQGRVPDVERVLIRLYGGWYEHTALTARASGVSVLLPSLNSSFPIISSETIIYGNIELATQLYDHQFIWYNSYREHNGLPKLRVNSEALGSECETHKSTCPVRILERFTATKIRKCINDGCNTKHGEVFFSRAQKYVDTMIACDIITLCMQDEIKGVFVFSDDEDHFPAMAVARDVLSTKAILGLFILNAQNKDNYESFLSPFDIEVTLIP